MLNYWRHKTARKPTTTTAITHKRMKHTRTRTHAHTRTRTHTHTQTNALAQQSQANRNNILRCIVNLNRRKDISRILSWQPTHTQTQPQHICVHSSPALSLSLSCTLVLVVHAVHVASAALYLDCCLVVARATYSPSPTSLPPSLFALSTRRTA